MKQRLIAFLAILVILGNLGTAYGAVQLENPGPEIIGTAGVVLDAKSGKFLYGKNENQRMFPASTTKILTTLVALEKGKLDDKVTVSEKPTQAGGSSVYLQKGETLTLEELLYCIMLNSANDAAVAVAEHIGGSVEGFTKLMNEKARELGAVDSNFANPNGLPNPEHYTTAHDLALIAQAAMKNTKFREIVGTKTKDISRSSAGSPTQLRNHNKLLWRYEGANGVKTGYTVLAKQCLVCSAQRGDQEIIAVVLGSVGQNIWQDSTKLLDYGFDNYQTMTAVEAGKQIRQVNIANSNTPVQAVAAENFYYTVDKNNLDKPQMSVSLTKGLKAPISKGSKIGQLVFSMDGSELGRVDLIAANSIVTKTPQVSWSPWVPGSVGTVGLVFGLRSLFKIRSKRRRNRRMRLYKENY